MPHAIQHLLKRTSLFVVVNYRVQTVINCGAFVMFIERLTVTGDYYFATNMYHVIGGPYEVARSFVDVARQTSSGNAVIECMNGIAINSRIRLKYTYNNKRVGENKSLQTGRHATAAAAEVGSGLHGTGARVCGRAKGPFGVD